MTSLTLERHASAKSLPRLFLTAMLASIITKAFMLTTALLLQAGLLIAETEFALQVESDIAPYKGLLMGLFFMTVGMEISVGLFFGRFRTVIAGILGLLIGKVCTMEHLTCKA